MRAAILLAPAGEILPTRSFNLEHGPYAGSRLELHDAPKEKLLPWRFLVDGKIRLTVYEKINATTYRYTGSWYVDIDAWLQGHPA